MGKKQVGKKQDKNFCKGNNYGGYGWCGVEAPPGTTGKYSKADGAWGGCAKAGAKANHPGGLVHTTLTLTHIKSPALYIVLFYIL